MKLKFFLSVFLLVSGLIGCAECQKPDITSGNEYVTMIPLSDIDVVRGEGEIVSAQFVTDKAQKIVLQVLPKSGDLEWIDNELMNSISSLKIWKNSVSAENLIFVEASSNMNPDGTIEFDGINYSDVNQYIIGIDVVDSIASVNNSPYQTSLIGVYRYDEIGTLVNIVDEPLISSRLVIVNNSGKIVITDDVNNEDNQREKTILAGESEFVCSADVQAFWEPMDVEKVIFTVTGASNLKNSVNNASLYLKDKLIDINSNSSIGDSAIIFDNLINIIIGEQTSELRLKLHSNTIGYQKVGVVEKEVRISRVTLEGVKGVNSGKDTHNESLEINCRPFNVVPVVVTPSITTSFNASTRPVLRFTSNVGDNTIDVANSAPNSLVNEVTLSTIGTNVSGNIVFTMYNIDDPSDSVSIVYNGESELVFNLRSMSDQGNRTISGGSSDQYGISISGTSEGNTVSLQYVGMNYNVVGVAGAVNLSTKDTINLDIGSRDY